MRGCRTLHTATFDSPPRESFAFIARRDAPVSPATRAFVEIVERRPSGFGELIL